jgi:ribosomal protein S18 acetylase RimI-like enzyme
MSEIYIRAMREEDTQTSADVHMHSFHQFFLTYLGKHFVRELYLGIVQDPGGIAFVAEEQGKIVGFVAGAVHLADLYRDLLRRRVIRFAWASLSGFIRKPSVLPRLLKAFRSPSVQDPLPKCGTLMSIGVLPEMQGKGVGQRLVQAFLAESRKRGLQHVVLHTDFFNNDRVNHFYQLQGFTLRRTYDTHEGRRMNEYIISLGTPEETSAPHPDFNT